MFTVVSVISTSKDLSNYAQIDGSYAGLGAGYLVDQSSLNNNTVLGWANVGSVLKSDIKNGAFSVLILVNGTQRIQGLENAEESGIIELDVNTSYDVAVSVLFGNLDPQDWCAQVTDTDIILYHYMRYAYTTTHMVVLAQKQYGKTADFRPFNFATSFTYGQSAPSNAVYAVVRNRASEDSEGNNIATTYARLASPVFTGTPTAPTPAPVDNSARIATTAFVHAVASGGGGSTLYMNQVIINIDDSGSNKYVAFNVYTTKNCDAAAGTNIAHLFDMFSADNALMVGFGIYSSDNKMYPCIINVSTDELFEPADQRISCIIIGQDNSFSIVGLYKPNCTCEIKHFGV